MKYSVVIPAFNEAGLLGACVDGARAAFAARGETAEIVVCDNNSTDGTAAVAAGGSDASIPNTNRPRNARRAHLLNTSDRLISTSRRVASARPATGRRERNRVSGDMLYRPGVGLQCIEPARSDCSVHSGRMGARRWS